MLDDNHDYFVYKTFTHKSKQARLKPLSKPISQPPPSPPSSYQPPDTVDYLRFLYVSSSSVKTPLSSQVGNFVLIDAFIVLSRVLSMVLFLRSSCCFPIGRVLISGDKSTSSHCTCCMSNANIARRALFGSFHALAGIPTHHLKHAQSPHW